MSFPWKRESRGVNESSGFPIKLGMTKRECNLPIIKKLLPFIPFFVISL